KAFAQVPGNADRVAHIVQRVENADQIEIALGDVGGTHGLEANIVEAGIASLRTRGVDRRHMEIETAKRRLRKGLRHQHRRRAITAANVRDSRAALQFFAYALERGNPLVDQMGVVAGAEEAVDTAKAAAVMLAPRSPAPAAEYIDRRVVRGGLRHRQLKQPLQECRVTFA